MGLPVRSHSGLVASSTSKTSWGHLQSLQSTFYFTLVHSGFNFSVCNRPAVSMMAISHFVINGKITVSYATAAGLTFIPLLKNKEPARSDHIWVDPQLPRKVSPAPRPLFLSRMVCWNAIFGIVVAFCRPIDPHDQHHIGVLILR